MRPGVLPPAAALGLALLLLGPLGAAASPGSTRIAASAARAVEVRNFTYFPRNITVLAGTTVTWTNFDADAHTITADDGSFDSYATGDPTSQGESWSHTFNATGTFPYHCAFHPWMLGRVTVYASPSEFQSPEARIAFRTDGLAVTLDGTSSSDSDGTVVGYTWDFGDGSTGQGPIAVHRYAVGGTYTVRLTVTDDGGMTADASVTLQVAEGPSLALLAGVGAAAAILLVAIILAVRRRRKP